ncbi:MarR family winged helix-turn-helix transcriptional regulator [Streptomyces sp. NPDC058195]|uniref:MarR family winged helix-turn-helix transcriptional regulator n=1 Tax=Streptomyces sp. NPDC058195 TaxID=3346375 RepID=UPI0036E08D6D
MQEPRTPSAAAPVASAEPAGGADAEELAVHLSAVVGRLLRRLRGTSSGGRLTLSQRAVLSRLDREGPATTAALARAEYVRPQSMRLTLGALESQGLVGRSPDPADGRKSVMALTAAGAAALAGVRAAKHDWLAEALAAELDGAERRTVAEAVELLDRLAGT